MFKFKGLSSSWSQDMAIDLGTANTLVVLKGTRSCVERTIGCCCN